MKRLKCNPFSKENKRKPKKTDTEMIQNIGMSRQVF
jgi:hypothetical protein